MTRFKLAVASAAWVLACAGACHRASPPGDVLLVTVDTLRADHVGAYGYARDTTPNVDRFFAQGTIFETSYASTSYTPSTVISILSGLAPQQHRVRFFFELLSPDVELLVDRLPAEYQTAAVVSNGILTDEAIGLASRFDVYDDYVGESEGSARVMFERSARRTTDAVLRWLRDDRDPDRPAFVWVHYIDPHGPYAPRDEPPRRFDHAGRAEVERARVPDYAQLETDDALDYVDRYDEEIAYVDAEVGRLLEAWQAAVPRAEDALVIFTSDHGEALHEGRERWFDHGFHVWEALVRVPLMIRGPGFEAERIAARVSSLDLAPTILAFTGIDAPEALDGLDLARADDLPADRMIHVDSDRFAAVVHGDRKWVAGFGDGPDPTELHTLDLGADPDERALLDFDAESAAGQRLLEITRGDERRTRKQSWGARGQPLRQPKIDPRVTDEQREMLRSLGYVDDEGGDE